jgi:hypothetical protein
MTNEEILSLYDAQMRRDPFDLSGRVTKLPELTWVTAEPPSHHGGWILYTRLDADTADAAIAAQVAEMSRRIAEFDEGFEWKVFDHDTPADLKLRLMAHGFVPGEPEALMALDLEDAPPRLWEPRRADIRRLSDPAQVEQITLVVSLPISGAGQRCQPIGVVVFTPTWWPCARRRPAPATCAS